MIATGPGWRADHHDWRRWVVYQVYPRSFADSDGDGVGDLRGVLAHLDHLQRLGVDVVWLSPVYRSPMDDNGYDISDYRDIDPIFGTLADFDELLAAVHERGMKLIMDLVANHTSDEHPWFVESRASRDNPKRDWYWWRDARGGHVPGTPGAEPTNWESHFSGSTWQWDEATGRYYLHVFSPKQCGLNWENSEVRQAIYAMMRWWIDRGVDGFRMDVINMISKDTSLPDTRPRPGSLYGPGDEHFICGPRNHEFLREMHREVFAARAAHVLTVGEMPGVTLAEAALFTDPQRQELDMVFQFEHVSLDFGDHRYELRELSLPALKASMAAWQQGLAENGWNSLYWGNHDQPRAVSRFGDDGKYRVASAKTLATVLHLHRGTPYVYQGDELGMRNAPFTAIGEYRDIEAVNAHAAAAAGGNVDLSALITAMGRMSRDHARTPVQWDASREAGFTTGTPWIATNPDHVEVNAAAQVGDPGSCSSTTVASSSCATPIRSSPTATSSSSCRSPHRLGVPTPRPRRRPPHRGEPLQRGRPGRPAPRRRLGGGHAGAHQPPRRAHTATDRPGAAALAPHPLGHLLNCPPGVIMTASTSLTSPTQDDGRGACAARRDGPRWCPM